MKRLIYLFVFALGLSMVTACSSQDPLEEISIKTPSSELLESEKVKKPKPQDSEEAAEDKSPFK